jgi:hypothetical protein
MAACDVGRMCLFIRSILWDLNIPQEATTVAYEDNDGCTAMGNAQKPTPRILVAAGVVLIINTQSDTADKSSIRGSSNERNLIVKSTAKFNFARLICLLIRGGSSSSRFTAVFDGGDEPGATAHTLSTHILADFRFVVV